MKFKIQEKFKNGKTLHDIDTELHDEMSQRHCCKIGNMCKHEREESKKDNEGWPLHPKDISEVLKERERVRRNLGIGS